MERISAIKSAWSSLIDVHFFFALKFLPSKSLTIPMVFKSRPNLFALCLMTSMCYYAIMFYTCNFDCKSSDYTCARISLCFARMESTSRLVHQSPL